MLIRGGGADASIGPRALETLGTPLMYTCASVIYSMGVGGGGGGGVSFFRSLVLVPTKHLNISWGCSNFTSISSILVPKLQHKHIHYTFYWVFDVFICKVKGQAGLLDRLRHIQVHAPPGHVSCIHHVFNYMKSSVPDD